MLFEKNAHNYGTWAEDLIFRLRHRKIRGMGEVGGDRRWKSDTSGFMVGRQEYNRSRPSKNDKKRKMLFSNE